MSKKTDYHFTNKSFGAVRQIVASMEGRDIDDIIIHMKKIYIDESCVGIIEFNDDYVLSSVNPSVYREVSKDGEESDEMYEWERGYWKTNTVSVICFSDSQGNEKMPVYQRAHKDSQAKFSIKDGDLSCRVHGNFNKDDMHIILYKFNGKDFKRIFQSKMTIFTNVLGRNHIINLDGKIMCQFEELIQATVDKALAPLSERPFSFYTKREEV